MHGERSRTLDGPHCFAAAPTRRVLLTAVVLVLWVAGAAPSVAAQWSAPTICANVTNPNEPDSDPFLTYDGSTLYFSSRSNSNMEIFRAQRASPYGTFSRPVRVAELCTNDANFGPTLRADGREIFFTRWKRTSLVEKIMRATRSQNSGPFSTPVEVKELNNNDKGRQFSPSITADGLQIFLTRYTPGIVDADIWTASRPSLNAPFGAPTRVKELNTWYNDRGAHVSPDGLTIVWSTEIPNTNVRQILMATRHDRNSAFGNVTTLSTPSGWGNSLESPSITLAEDEIFFSTRSPRNNQYPGIWRSRFSGLTAEDVAGPGRKTLLHFSQPAHAGRSYVAALSLGTSPGIPIGTQTIPLVPDAVFAATVGGLPPFFVGMAGYLDRNGVATGSITFPPIPALKGVRLYAAFVVVDPQQPHGIGPVSRALEILLQ